MCTNLEGRLSHAVMLFYVARAWQHVRVHALSHTRGRRFALRRSALQSSR